MNEINNNEGFDDVQKEVQRVQKIKFVITCCVFVCVVGLTILFWDNSDVYAVQLDGDRNQGIEWTYTLSKKGIVEEKTNYYASGVYSFEFEGVKQGEVEIKFTCIKDGDADNPVEKQTYAVRVDKNLRVVTKALYKQGVQNEKL